MYLMLRCTLLGLSFLVCSPLILLLCVIRPFHPDNTRDIVHFLGKIWRHIIPFTVKRIGPEFTNFKQPHVFIANHQSNWDLVVLSQMVPKRTVSLGKKEIFFIPIFGFLFWLSGNILINRKNKKRAISAMEKVSNIITRKKINVLIMPEGTRSRHKGLLPFKKGAFITAINAGAPIQPIVFNSYAKTFFPENKNAGFVAYKFLKPISTEGLTLDNVDELKDKCRDLMLNELRLLDEQCEKLS